MDSWVRRYDAAVASKRGFQQVGDQCYGFYAGDCGHMWTNEFLNKYVGKDIGKPQFEVTINKTSEYVSVFGPHVFWGNPQVTIKPLPGFDFSPAAFGPEGDEEAMQLYQGFMQEQEQRSAVADMRAQLIERVVNYSTREQHCNLAHQGMMAVIDTMIRGMGCLWHEKYKFPGSDRTLVGGFWDSVNNIFVDPDCNDPEWKSARYIIRRRFNTAYELEKRFKLERGALKDSATIHTNEHSASNSGPRSENDKAECVDGDLIEWYEVYSRDGIGVRNMRSIPDSKVAYALDEIVGDFAYLCFTKKEKFLLNAHPDEIAGESDEEIMERLTWPLLSHFEGQWPVSRLFFIPNPESAWPIPPLGPALGELITLNILVSCFLEQAYANRKTIIAYLKSHAGDVERIFKENTRDGISFLPIADAFEKSISNVITYLNRPEMNRGLLDAIQYVSELFDKRVGLNELMYGMSQTQSRSATDATEKASRSQVRPDKMAEDVAKWMSGFMQLLKFHTITTVEGKHVEPLLGAGGAYLWDTFIAAADPEEVARSMDATVEASEVRKPDHARDAQNLRDILPVLLPAAQQYAFIKGNDPTGSDPLNGLLKAYGKSIDQPMDGLLFGPFAPPPPDEQMAQVQQMLQQLEMDKTSADTELVRAKAAKETAAAAGSPEAMAKQQMEFEFDAGKKQMDIEHQRASADIDIQKQLIEMELKQILGQQEVGQNAAKFMFQGAQIAQAGELKRRSKENA